MRMYANANYKLIHIKLPKNIYKENLETLAESAAPAPSKSLLPFKPYMYSKYDISNEFVKYRKEANDDIEDPVVISESLAKQYADNVTPITSRIDGDILTNATYGSDIITGFGSETGKDDRVDLIKALHEAGKATIERIEKGETTKEDNDMIDFLHDLFNV